MALTIAGRWHLVGERDCYTLDSYTGGVVKINVSKGVVK